MSKIIIHNKSKHCDELALQAVEKVVADGFTSGENQYCWLTKFSGAGVTVIARKARGTTHSFDVRNSQ